MVPNLSFTALRAFEALARNGSVTRTAAELGLSAPAISMQLKQLETKLSVALVSRSKRGILRGAVLTPHGVALARMVQRWLAELELLIVEFSPSRRLIADQAEALLHRINHLRSAPWWEARETAADILSAGQTILEDISRAGIATGGLPDGDPKDTLMLLDGLLRRAIEQLCKAACDRVELSITENGSEIQYIVALDERRQNRRSSIRRSTETGIAGQDRQFRAVADVELLVNAMKIDLD